MTGTGQCSLGIDLGALIFIWKDLNLDSRFVFRSICHCGKFGTDESSLVHIYRDDITLVSAISLTEIIHFNLKSYYLQDAEFFEEYFLVCL